MNIKEKLLNKKNSIYKGGVGNGMVFVVILVLMVIAIAFTLIGGELPQLDNSRVGSPVVLVTSSPQNAKNNLQLYTFIGLTITPSPTPAPTPIPTPTIFLQATPTPLTPPTYPTPFTSPTPPAHTTPPNCSPTGALATVYPVQYPNALKNPMMGFYQYSPWMTYDYVDVPWNAIERNSGDTVAQVRSWTNTRLNSFPAANKKAIMRVVLDVPSVGRYWPADMTDGDYNSPQFISRLQGLIAKIGQAWDNDPRIAYVQTGLIGPWGEQAGGILTSTHQTVMGDAFTAAFHNKKLQVRYPYDFTSYNFGMYWDSFALIDQEYLVPQYRALSGGNRWKTQMFGNEVAYDYLNFETQPGHDPNDSLSDPVHRNYIIDRIKDLHVTGLTWISGYSTGNSAAAAGAELMQKEFGYRYVISRVDYTQNLTQGANMDVSFVVKNVASAPIYYNWPVEVSLLNPTTKAVAWSGTFTGVDIRNWLPGSNYNYGTRSYNTPAVDNTVYGSFLIPGTVPTGEYILALAILDPSGNLPTIKFAINNYYNGGRHPIGKVGIGTNVTNITVSNFDNPANDNSLHYVYSGDVVPPTSTLPPTTPPVCVPTTP